MVFRMKVEMDNAAFEDDEGRPELARILRHVAPLVQGDDAGPVYDVNGNQVGTWKIVKA